MSSRIYIVNKHECLSGALIALGLIVLWAASTFLLLGASLNDAALWWGPPALFLQTFLFTGLFITAHDAMHGAVCPQQKYLNNGIGILCAVFYALFSYKTLKLKHREHHRQPATASDPDFHDEKHPGFLRWYIRFLGEYVRVLQIVGMALVFNALHHLLDVPLSNLILFWVIPALLSTIQLFYFGTFLPHRRPAGGYSDHHRALSSGFSPVVSFITCFHFGGFHWEHHAYPHVPWWRLPRLRRNIEDRTA